MRILPVLLCLALCAAPLEAQRGKRNKQRKSRPKTEETAISPERKAELIRIAEEREAEKRAEIEAATPLHFRLCDLDQSGWVSFREARATLSLDKEDFRSSDGDGDGRLSLDEFRDRHVRLLEQFGPVNAPLPTTEELERIAVAEGSEVPFAPRTAEPPATPAVRPPSKVESTERAQPAKRPRTMRPPARRAALPAPGQLLTLYDADTSRGLGLEEVTKVVRQLGGDLSPELLLQQTDRDETGELELHELGPLAFFAADRLPQGMRPADPVPTASLERVPHPYHRRLDVDGSGAVAIGDLRRLLKGARPALRLSTLIAVLDDDGDGELSESEFRRALGAN